MKTWYLLLPNLAQKSSFSSSVYVNTACKRLNNSVGMRRLCKVAWLMNLLHAIIAISCACRCSSFNSSTAAGGNGGTV